MLAKQILKRTMLLLMAVGITLCANATYLGTQYLRASGNVAINSMNGPWYYMPELANHVDNHDLCYEVYTDKIVVKGGHEYTYARVYGTVGGRTVYLYTAEPGYSCLRVDNELMEVYEEAGKTYFYELTGNNWQLLTRNVLDSELQEQRRQQQIQNGLDMMAQGLNQLSNSLSQLSGGNRTATPAPRQQTRPAAPAPAQQADQWIPTQVLEIHSGLSIRTTHTFHNWYRKYNGNRWCLYRHKGSTDFFVASLNNERTFEGFDVSGYKYKAIAPTGMSSTGTRYYFFN